jgi:alpha-amylase
MFLRKFALPVQCYALESGTFHWYIKLFRCLTDFNPNPIVGYDWDHKTKTKSIFKFVGPGHKGWSRNVDTELGNYDYLLGCDVSVLHIDKKAIMTPKQIDHRHPAVQQDLMAWGEWILEVSTMGATYLRF